MRHHISIWPTVLLIGSFAGCSTELLIHDVSGEQWNDLTCDQKGLPFRVLEPVTVRLMYRNKSNELKAVEGKSFHADLPHPDHLYTINYKAKYFSKSTVKLTLNEDGSIKKVELVDTNTIPQALKDFGKATKDVGTAATDYENTRKKQEADTLQQEIDLLKKRKDLIEAQKSLEEALKKTNSGQ